MQSESCPSDAGRCNMPGEQRVESSWANSCDSLDLSTETLSRNARLHIRIQAKRLQETGTLLNRCNASRDRYSEENCDIMQQPEAFKAELSFIFMLNGISLSVWQRSFSLYRNSPENNIQLCSGKHHAMGDNIMSFDDLGFQSLY